MLGLAGFFDLYINRIEKALTSGDKEQAAREARPMYEDIARSAFIKPMAQRFLRHWLGIDEPESSHHLPIVLNPDEVEKILDDSYTRGFIGFRLKQQGDARSRFVKGLKITRVYGGEPRSDAFFALGEFTIIFTGCITVNKANTEANLNGVWSIVDIYDWQDPNPPNKAIELGGSIMYDRYAELLEDSDPPMAYEFPVYGSGRGISSKNVELLASPPEARF